MKTSGHTRELLTDDTENLFKSQKNSWAGAGPGRPWTIGQVKIALHLKSGPPIISLELANLMEIITGIK